MHNSEDIRDLVSELQKFPVVFDTTSKYEELHSALANYLNQLITSDFSRLISLLYRLDISENKLKELLAHQEQASAGDIIAAMIIERQLQKIESKRRFRSNDKIDEAEKW